MSNYEDLKAQAKQTIILNDKGLPLVMEAYPLVYLDELGIGATHTPHPAFKINDKVLPKIYLPAYIASVKGGRAYSLPNQEPAVNVNFDQAKQYCENNGAGFHLMTAAEWGLVHNLLTASGIHPRGNTAYGKSKLKAERFLESVGNNFPYVILRPTGVYGPREKDYFMMAKSISNHIDFAVGFQRQDITFVYVKDVVQAIFLTLDHGMNGRKYFLSDGNVYRSSDFSNLIRKALGNPWWIRITAPVWVLRIVTSIGELVARSTGRISALNHDKFNILRQRNWRCDIEPTMDELGYHPHYDLARGVAETIDWYKNEGWL